VHNGTRNEENTQFTPNNMKWDAPEPKGNNQPTQAIRQPASSPF